MIVISRSKEIYILLVHANYQDQTPIKKCMEYSSFTDIYFFSHKNCNVRVVFCLFSSQLSCHLTLISFSSKILISWWSLAFQISVFSISQVRIYQDIISLCYLTKIEFDSEIQYARLCESKDYCQVLVALANNKIITIDCSN